MNSSLLCFGATAALTLAVQAAPANGPLRAHPDNSRYFTDGTKRPDGSLRAVYLTGSHTWNNLVDMGRGDPPEKFDFDAYLDFLEKYGHNFIRLWAWDSTRWDTRSNGGLGKDFVHRADPLPWLRTGPGEALDGGPKFDLNNFDPVYFERLRSRTGAAGDRGIYVSVMLFEGWGLMHGNRGRAPAEDGWAWKSHPFNPANNINGLEVEGANALEGKVHRLGNASIRQIQAGYIRKVVETVNDLDNVLYEVINEGGEKEWDWWIVETVREAERTRPKQHPVGITGHGAERLESMLASPADWVSPGRADGYGEDPPVWSGGKVSLLDTDHIWGVGGNARWAWKSFLRGHQPLFMDPYDGSVLGRPGDERWEQVRLALGQTLRIAETLRLDRMQPRQELSSTGDCLANPGEDYVIYQPEAGEAFSVELEKGRYRFEWFDPANGEFAEEGEVEAPGGSQRFEPPEEGDAVLILRNLGASR